MMSEKTKLRYEKPVSINMGRVAPVLGDSCSIGEGADDCPQGNDNTVEETCNPSGASATNRCLNGSGAGSNCQDGSSALNGCSIGSSAVWGCFAGDLP